jgi:hypothetical protein
MINIIMTSITSSNQLYDQLDQLTDIQSRIDLMETLSAQNYPFHLERQPEALLQRFYSDNVSAEAVADVFILCFGYPLICREASLYAREPMTILDCLADQLYENDRIQLNQCARLIYAFHTRGIVNAEWYCPLALEYSYRLDPHYRTDTTIVFPLADDSDELDSSDSECESDISDLDNDSRIVPLPQAQIDYLLY